jgi:23S rRNA (uracil1939-C5)-methyltransferase
MSERVTIESVGIRGDGLATIAGERVHVPFVLPGEEASITREGERGTLHALLTRSAERVEPVCRHFGTCGGCAVQHWAADQVAEWKKARIAAALKRARIDAEIRPVIDAHGDGRRRVALHVRYPKAPGGRIEAGFMRSRSHALVDLDTCPLLVPALGPAPDVAREIGHVLRGLAKPLDVQATTSREGLDIDIRGAGRLPEALRLKLIDFGRTHDLARLTLHGERLIEARTPSVSLGDTGLAAYLPPGSFLQATAKAEDTLAAFAIDHVAGAKHVADLFCGLGPFALRLSRLAKVTAMDSDKPAIEALERSMRAHPGGKPLHAEARDLFRRPLFASELKPFDAVIVDPPRQGAEAQMREIAKSRLARVVSISCDPESFARDCRALIDAGFRLGPVTAVDQFRHSPHVELMAVLTR